jgi:hypothetical protein|tara:strand:- start:30 stop:1661 length:1632 start_codon:yes stop_codon:yes gene_type:complete
MDEKYIKFFEGYRQAYGVADMSTLKIDPESRKQKPIYRWNDEQLTDKIYKNHLEGTQSIGVQPCNENGQARFGVIDIDPNDYGDFDRKFFIDTLQTYNLPLIPVLSKSGGLHLYMFIDKFIDASLIKSFLSNLLPIFKLKPDTEIFPKQTQLTKDNETGQLNKGNFINLPYFKKTERVAINVDGTQFTFDQFIEVIENNTVSQEDLKIITDSIEKQDMEGVDEEFIEGPPCLAHLSKIMKDPKFDGKDRFMYNYHVFVKMKYPDDWQKKVKNAPVKYFIGEHANAWDDKMVAAKVRSWTKQFKGFTCTQSPISEHCKRGICVKKKFGILAGSKGNYPVLTNLKKIDLDPEPEYEFDVTKPDGISTATVHCRSIEHVNDQRKRRNAIAKAAGFPPPIIKGDEDQTVLEELFKTQKLVHPPIGTSPKEKLHDVLHAKINGPKAMNDASFKSGTVLIEDGYAYFKFDKFYDKLRSKNWKYSEDKTGVMMKVNYKQCDIQFLEQKRYPTKEKGKYNTPTKNIVMIDIDEFKDIIINHTRIKHNTEIM